MERPKPNYEALRKQDPQEWESFVTNYHDLFLGVAYKSGLTDFNAEDAVQESLLNFYLHRETIDPDSSPVGYIATSIRNKARDAGRYSGRHPQDLLEDVDPIDSNPYESWGNIDLRLDLDNALTHATPMQQGILHDIRDGYTFNEIARHIDTPRGTTGRRIKDAKEAVQPFLAA